MARQLKTREQVADKNEELLWNTIDTDELYNTLKKVSFEGISLTKCSKLQSCLTSMGVNAEIPIAFRHAVQSIEAVGNKENKLSKCRVFFQKF